MSELASAVMGKKPTPIAPPTPQPVVRMPDKNDPSVIEARRRKRNDMAAGGGRESTILTDSDTVVPEYSNSALGQ